MVQSEHNHMGMEGLPCIRLQERRHMATVEYKGPYSGGHLLCAGIKKNTK